jgi:high-affinity iron transporter
LALVAVAREGSETVVFLYGTLSAAQHVWLAGTMVATIIGFSLALATYYVLQLSGRVLSWKVFFGVTEIMLLLLAGSLLVTGAENLGDLGVLPTLSGRLWNSSGILPDSGPVGGLLAALTGYRARPNLMDVLVYALYWGVIFWTLFWSRPKISTVRT